MAAVRPAKPAPTMRTEMPDGGRRGKGVVIVVVGTVGYKEINYWGGLEMPLSNKVE